ncbi:hypothetical protein BH23BAC2_BH23BAC2_16580 [soil metagenome]
MLLIYTPKVTSRIIYVFKHVCTHILGLELQFTTKIEEFIAHEGPKFSYGKKRLGNELFVQNVDLLLEQGLSDLIIKVMPWEDTKCFFSVSENSDIPFDIFSASFYLLSRYEEYLPHVKDDFGRFPSPESLAYKNGFLRQPVIELWAYKFKKLLQNKFDNLQCKPRSFSAVNIISVSHVFNFQNKGFLRSLIGTVLDITKFKFSRASDRFRVLLKLKKDPYMVYEDLLNIVKKYKTKMVFMFQLSDYNSYDKNINYNRQNYSSIIKHVADYCGVGLRLGYFAVQEDSVLKVEKKRFENIVHGPLQNVINPKYNLMLPLHYSNLNELDVKNDYSMGFPESTGFRAGTSTSFLFYDINLEVTTPLTIHPYIFHTQSCHTGSEEDIEKVIEQLKGELKKVDGTFRAVFKNRDFSEYANHDYFYALLKRINEIQ